VRWRVLASRAVYRSPWVDVDVDDVEVPDGHRIEHHVVKFPRPSVGAVVLDGAGRTLLLWRHRYITDTWGWEVPAGWADPGEPLVDAARREVEEETGYRVGDIRPMVEYKPMAGISTMHYTGYVATDPVRVGEPADTSEASRVEWIALADVPRLAGTGRITDGPSLTLLCYYLVTHRLGADS
jgi:8-oxo-dGTP pyrophosphatase MutT (NUDIX family)